MLSCDHCTKSIKPHNILVVRHHEPRYNFSVGEFNNAAMDDHIMPNLDGVIHVCKSCILKYLIKYL